MPFIFLNMRNSFSRREKYTVFKKLSGNITSDIKYIQYTRTSLRNIIDTIELLERSIN